MALGRKIRKIGLAAILLSGCAKGSIMESVEEAEPLKTPPNGCYASHLEKYNPAIEKYQEEYGLSEEWRQWMVDNPDRYCFPFAIGNFYQEEFDGTIVLSLNYYDGVPVPYTKPYPDNEHEKDFERLIELTYPGYDIVAEFGRDPEQSNGVVYLNAPEPSHANRRKIYLHYETIVGHEFAHFMGMPHHYDTIDRAGEGDNMPPGEEVCLMDRTSNQLGISDRAALGIDPRIDNGKEIQDLVTEILNKYPPKDPIPSEASHED